MNTTDTARAHAHASCELDGVSYRIDVERDEKGITDLVFTSDPPPEGLDRERYSWHGNLQRMRAGR